MSQAVAVDVTVRRIAASQGALLKSIRLSALRDSPSAFGSSYDAEVAHEPEHWTRRARQAAAGHDSATSFAVVDHQVVGLVSAYRPDPRGTAIELVSMWITRRARRRGAARKLVDSVVAWASEAGAEAIELWVTDGNAPAVALYRTVGFRATGVRQPLSSDPARLELRMRLPLLRSGQP